MAKSRVKPAKFTTANKGLKAVNEAIYELDDAIQGTRNLELSRTLNEIYDSYQSIRQIMKALKKKKGAQSQVTGHKKHDRY